MWIHKWVSIMFMCWFIGYSKGTFSIHIITTKTILYVYAGSCGEHNFLCLLDGSDFDVFRLVSTNLLHQKKMSDDTHSHPHIGFDLSHTHNRTWNACHFLNIFSHRECDVNDNEKNTVSGNWWWVRKALEALHGRLTFFHAILLSMMMLYRVRDSSPPLSLSLSALAHSLENVADPTRRRLAKSFRSLFCENVLLQYVWWMLAARALFSRPTVFVCRTLFQQHTALSSVFIFLIYFDAFHSIVVIFVVYLVEPYTKFVYEHEHAHIHAFESIYFLYPPRQHQPYGTAMHCCVWKHQQIDSLSIERWECSNVPLGHNFIVCFNCAFITHNKKNILFNI